MDPYINLLHTYTHTHTHTYIYIYIYGGAYAYIWTCVYMSKEYILSGEKILMPVFIFNRICQYEGGSKSSKLHPDFRFVVFLLHSYEPHLKRNYKRYLG